MTFRIVKQGLGMLCPCEWNIGGDYTLYFGFNLSLMVYIETGRRLKVGARD